MDRPIVIIGAGVAGLVAALHLEKAGYTPMLLEASDRVGGRVKTDQEAGFLLDHGFQVLLTAYREAREYLDFDALDLQRFQPGALIFAGDRSFRVTDPLRQPSGALDMLLSPAGSLKDKWLIWKLTRELKRSNRSDLFKEGDISTERFLRDYGFSDRIIEQFFRPFFGGIFLENELQTDAGMFRFVFKMFGEGFAAIPRKGMEQIPRQLKSRLTKTEFRFQARVKKVEGRYIYPESGQPIEYSKLIIATDPNPLIPALKGQSLEWESTCNLYFEAEHSPIGEAVIALVADKDNIINNWCVLSDVSSAYAPAGKALVSVVLKEMPAPGNEQIAEQAIAALERLTGRNDLGLRFLARYDIPHALPRIGFMEYDIPFTQSLLTENIYLAGDYLLNASLDAAMRSGRKAAQALIQGI